MNRVKTALLWTSLALPLVSKIALSWFLKLIAVLVAVAAQSIVAVAITVAVATAALTQTDVAQ
jgi:hypothetical protein